MTASKCNWQKLQTAFPNWSRPPSGMGERSISLVMVDRPMSRRAASIWRTLTPRLNAVKLEAGKRRRYRRGSRSIAPVMVKGCLRPRPPAVSRAILVGARITTCAWTGRGGGGGVREREWSLVERSGCAPGPIILSGVADSVAVMPSAMHETLVELFRHRPALAGELLGEILGLDIPHYDVARLDSAEATDPLPTEFRADAVVVLASHDTPVLAVVIEIQLRADPGKHWSWPAYVATLRSRLRCPTELLVVCSDATTATECAGSITLGISGSHLTPLVIGPDRVPTVPARTPGPGVAERSVLAALAHGRHPDHYDVLDMLIDALATIETSQATLYLRLVHAALPQAARRHLEALMKTSIYDYESELFDELRAEGEARGEARGTVTARVQAVLTVLDAAAVDVSDEARTRITNCADLDQLETWLRRAVHATTIDDLFS